MSGGTTAMLTGFRPVDAEQGEPPEFECLRCRCFTARPSSHACPDRRGMPPLANDTLEGYTAGLLTAARAVCEMCGADVPVADITAAPANAKKGRTFFHVFTYPPSAQAPTGQKFRTYRARCEASAIRSLIPRDEEH